MRLLRTQKCDTLNAPLSTGSNSPGVCLVCSQVRRLFNNGALDTNTADYIGSSTNIANGIAEGTATKAADYFYDFGMGDLSGFLQTPLTFLEIPL